MGDEPIDLDTTEDEKIKEILKLWNSLTFDQQCELYEILYMEWNIHGT